MLQVGIIFPTIFQRAAVLFEIENAERRFLESFQVDISAWALRKGETRTYMAWVILILYALGTQLLTLLYCMQFDTKSPSTFTAPLSTQWLISCLLSFLQGLVINAPFLIILRMFLYTLRGRQLLAAKEREGIDISSKKLVSIHLQPEELDLTDMRADVERIDIFLAWLLRRVVWVPTHLRPRSLTADSEGYFNKVVNKDVAFKYIFYILLFSCCFYVGTFYK